MLRNSLIVFVVGLIAIGLSVSLTYEEQSAATKYQLLWNKITGNLSPGPWPSAANFAYIFIEDMGLTMDTVSDELPEKRQKLIHSVGGVAGCRFDFVPNNYTGIFKSGAEYALCRVSTAIAPPAAGKDASEGFTPGGSFKLLRSGVPSGNFMAMRALTPAPSWNPFKFIFSNHVTGKGLSYALTLLRKKFETGSKWPIHLGLSDLARYDKDGKIYNDNQLNFPFQLLLVPNPTLQQAFPDTYSKELIAQLAQIPVGTNLWDIYAIPEADSTYQIKIGSITSTTRFTSSNYADTTLFFKHQRFEEDLTLRSNWAKTCPTADSCPVCPLDVACPPVRK